MKIALHGTYELTEFDKKEIQDYLYKITRKNEIVLLAYRSIEIEVFTFFLENEHLAPKLTIYTFQPFNNLPRKLKETILFLVEKGTKYISFEFTGDKILRPFYKDVWTEIIKTVDLTVTFYDNKKYDVLIPIDVAKSFKFDAMIYELPGDSLIKHKHKMEHKVRIV